MIRAPDPERLERALARWLGGGSRLLRVERLAKSTRDAPWRVDVDLEGETKSFVLRLGAERGEHEVVALRAVEGLAIPTPRVRAWDPRGEALGLPASLIDFVEGVSLLPTLRAGEAWAENLYLDSVLALQAVSREEAGPLGDRTGDGETAAVFLELATHRFESCPDAVAETMRVRLLDTMPPLSEVRFGNGDLYPDNFLVRGGDLAGVIDWENAGFSDPLYEFLLAFFVHPDLRGRGLEERFCARADLDPATLPWYRALEVYDTWSWVRSTGKPFHQHTEESLRADAAAWLATM